MSAALVAQQLTVVRGRAPVLERVDLTVEPGRRIGLVGPNGVGKSTLLAALPGTIPLDGGSVTRHPPSLTVGLLPQEPQRGEEPVAAFLARRTGVADADAELDAAAAAIARSDSGADDRYALALERWSSLGAADFDGRVGEVWAQLGLDPRLLETSTGVLSGGEAARVSLASLLLARYDVFLLDEPTNDLDLVGLDHLERWVTGLRAGVVVVSHDRTFLERVVTDVVELDPHTRGARRYGGGWTSFLDERRLARQHAQQAYDDYAARRDALLERAQRQREWAQQGLSKVRRSDESDKFIRHFKTVQTEQLAGKAARTQKALERLDEVEEPRTAWELRLSIPTAGRSGDRVAWASDAVVERGSFRLGPITTMVGVGDRIAVVGANGAGKSTLLDLLLGRIAPAEGTAGLGAGVVVGEIEQARDRFLGDASLLDAFVAATGTTLVDARTLLAKFGLGADEVLRPGATLSPGERTRASLALLMEEGANLLVLDEPTNHLDLEAIEQLEQALDTFEGTVLLVTHDRSMLERVRLSRTITVADGCVEESLR